MLKDLFFFVFECVGQFVFLFIFFVNRQNFRDKDCLSLLSGDICKHHDVRLIAYSSKVAFRKMKL